MGIVYYESETEYINISGEENIYRGVAIRKSLLASTIWLFNTLSFYSLGVYYLGIVILGQLILEWYPVDLYRRILLIKLCYPSYKRNDLWRF